LLAWLIALVAHVDIIGHSRPGRGNCGCAAQTGNSLRETTLETQLRQVGITPAKTLRSPEHCRPDVVAKALTSR